MPSYISPGYLTTDSPEGFQEITVIVFTRHGNEWICALREADTCMARGRGACMEFALTSAVNARNDALRDAGA